MNIPKFWASAEVNARKRTGEVIPVKKWDWSNHGTSDAERKAWQSVEAAAARVAAGEPFPDRSFYYAEQPLREEIVKELPDAQGQAAIITRNSYGCLVLNTAKVMFIDIDLPAQKPSQPSSGLLSRLFGKPKAAPVASAEATALAQVKSYADFNANWSFRAYRTASGLRLMATHDVFDPDSPLTLKTMEALGSDPLYVKLCRSQKSFRARLTPKPWRVGLQNPKLHFPYPAEEASSVSAWCATYSQRSAPFATCAFLSSFGSDMICAEARQVIEEHDRETKANQAGLALA
jgi:hypothetical protein